jgi:PAS domain S-box-containing protein
LHQADQEKKELSYPTRRYMTRIRSDPAVLTVLYVDDEPDLLDIATIFLESTGNFTIETSTSVREAMAKLCETQYDAIVSDYQMPEKDGIAFLKEIRSIYGHIPFILFTGKGREEVVIQALENGADFYLQKGGEPRSQFAELRNKIEKAVSEKRALEARLDSERRLADIINFLPDATFAIDGQGKVIAWNLAMEQMTGVPADRIMGKGEYEYALYVYNERRPLLLDYILTGTSGAGEYYDRITQDGNRLFSEKYAPFIHGGKGGYLWFVASPLYDSHGTIIGAIESIRDITAQKKLESSLRTSESRYHNVFNSTAEAMLVVDRDSAGVLDANPQACRLYGYKRDEIRDKRCTDLTADNTRMVPEGQTGMQRITGQEHRRKDGTTFPAELSFNIYPQKRRTIVILNIRDITERIRADEETRVRNEALNAANARLAASEERYRSIFQNASDITRILNPEGTIMFDSASTQRILGYPEGFFIGRKTFEFIHPDDRERVMNDFIEVCNRTNPSLPTEFRIRRADGEYVWVEAVGVNLLEDPAVNGIVVTSRPITERKRIEAELVQREEHYRTLLSNAAIGLFFWSPDGTLLFVNDHAARSIESTPAAMQGKSVTDLFGPTLGQVFLERIQDAAGRDTPTEYEDFLPLPAGEGWFLSLLSRLTDSSGDLRGVQVLSIDISSRKKAREEIERNHEELQAAYEQLEASEKELHRNFKALSKTSRSLARSEERLKRLFEHMDEGLALHELVYGEDGRVSDYRILAVNPAYERYVGIKQEDAAGRTATDLYGTEEPPYLDIYSQVALTGKPASFDTYFPPLQKHFKISAYSPKKRQFATIFLDITEMKQKEGELARQHGDLEEMYEELAAGEEELRKNYDDLRISQLDLSRSRQQYRNVLDRLQDAYFRTDREGFLQEVNPSAARMFGYGSADEMIGTPILTFYSNPKEREKLLEYLDVHKSVADWVMEGQRKDGSSFWASLNVQKLYDERGEHDGTEGFMRDITARKNDEEALREANKKLNILSSITRHDIINQLTLLRAYIDLVGSEQATILENDPKFQKLGQIAERIDTIIRFTKEYQDIGVASPVFVNFHRVVDETWDKVPHEGVTLVNTVDDNVDVYADPLIHMVVFNLIDNAFRHGGPSLSTIRFGSSSDGDTLVLVYDDDGAGVPKNEKEKIFEQGHGKNFGFGLFLTREILAISGITIRETGVPGKGARFEITVPQGKYRQARKKRAGLSG